MSWHLHGVVLTPEGVASNNRGEVAGNVSTLQKLIRAGEIYTTVSAEAIRHAIREQWSAMGLPMNRIVTDGESKWSDTTFASWQSYVDDDVLGFMHPQQDTVKRRGRLEISRAVSTRAWTGDIMFNAAAPGAHPRQNEDPIPYSCEVHLTRYQFGFALTPQSLAEPSRAFLALDAIVNLSGVAGNHSRYLFDFSPDAVALRWTEDPAPRILNCFAETEHGKLTTDALLHALEAKDILAEELVVGGRPLSGLAETFELHGVTVFQGVKQAFGEIRRRMGAA